EVPAQALTEVPLGARTLATSATLHSRPTPQAPALDSLGEGTAVEVLGTSGDWRLVRTAERTGFVAATSFSGR
ncbi:MAG TPA: SH3 domain-containing protein, partial [Rhodothermales bacterium]|nr:SH3 domain-containing protein [Rhodothermales bacterium]